MKNPRQILSKQLPREGVVVLVRSMATLKGEDERRRDVNEPIDVKGAPVKNVDADIMIWLFGAKSYVYSDNALTEKGPNRQILMILQDTDSAFQFF